MRAANEPDRITRALLEHETLDEETFHRLVSGTAETPGPEEIGSVTAS